MTSPSRNLGSLPPPPRVASSSTNPKSNEEPHHSNVPIPGLASAPPSANFNTSNLASTMGMASGMSSLFSSSTAQSPSTGVAFPSFGSPPPLPKIESSISQQQQTESVALPIPPTVDRSAISATPLPPKVTCLPPNNRNILNARRQTYLPVLIVASEKAHKLAWKNELRLVDLVQGLYSNMVASFQNGNSPPHIPPFRSLSRFLHLTWNDLDVRFVDEFVTMDDKQAATLLSQQAQIHPSDGNLESELCLLEDQVDNLLLEQPPNKNDHTITHEERQRQLDQTHKDAFDLTSPLSIPWLQRYRQALDDSTDDAQHDLFHCPALCLVICTTQEETGPIETLRSLSSSKFYLPHHFQNGWMNPNALQHQVLVLHDNVDGAQNWNEQQLINDLKKEFGSASACIRMNSLSLETAQQLSTEEKSDLWNGGGRLGNCLSMNDRASLRQFLTSLAVEALLPALESRIATLNAIVSERKKGVRNVLKSFWRTGKPKDAEPDTQDTNTKADGVRYKFDTVENQTRLLADTLFILADYEGAYSSYKLIKDDFKQDKAHAHYASVQEMMALSLYHMDAYGRAREVFSLIENAIWSYSRAADDERGSSTGGRVTEASLSTRLATRLCLVLTALQNVITGRHLEVADLLASASSNENALGAAVLLEQGSAHYFHADLYRKYAFHMLMSGHMYRSAEQNHHAFRCFTSSLYIYRDGKWDELHNHIRSALAAQLFSMGRMAIALQLYGKLVGCSEGGCVSTKSQQKYVSNLLEICNEHTKKALAGADRLAAPSYLTGVRRDAIRKEKLDRIVQVVRYTKGASRVLELLHVNLPIIDDSSVVVLAEEASHHRQESVQDLGEACSGDGEIWDELMLSTNAELRAAVEDKVKVDDEVISTAIRAIRDPEIRNVITEIDREQLSRNRKARAKRSAGGKEMPPVRAQREPYFIEFAMKNPLGISIDLSDVQLVAKMSSADTCCTNEDAILITQLVSYEEKPKWTFIGKEEFFIADFCRISSDSSENERGKWKAAEEASPFFVVTKTDHTLAPESLTKVALGICPLEKGKLEVLGVRFRLFNAVWLYHQFEIQGKLLQDTRYNRANRVRGEPMFLKANVERGMPCLTVEILPAHPSAPVGPVLQGQIRPWILRVENIGTAPARNATLKTNVPWIRILTESTDLSGRVSNCIGPTGTLMSFPLRDGKLNPGESVDVPVEIRIAQSGKQGLYMLFRYELLAEHQNEKVRSRWLRKMVEINVYPSVTLAASVVPSNQIPGEHILFLEIANNRADSPADTSVTLSDVFLASWRYRIVPFDGQFDESSVELGWQERVASHFRVVPAGTDESNDTFLSQSDFSGSISHHSSNSDSRLSFLCLESAHALFEETLIKHRAVLARAEAAQDTSNQQPRSISQIRRANTTLSELELDTENTIPVEATSILRLCPRDAGEERTHLVLSWHGKNGAISGALFLCDLSVRPKTEGCPIFVTAKYPSRISNDFAIGPATIPFTVLLRNSLTKTPVSIEFSVEGTESLNLSGPVYFKKNLEGDEEISVPLQAMVTSPGIYDLQHIRLNIINSENATTYRFSLQWLVAVTST